MKLISGLPDGAVSGDSEKVSEHRQLHEAPSLIISTQLGDLLFGAFLLNGDLRPFRGNSVFQLAQNQLGAHRVLKCNARAVEDDGTVAILDPLASCEQRPQFNDGHGR